ncbi:MAG: hypothetical protein CRN43_09135 [Candidatus Nephrothrix sp. EaCA]|nr:MAG: hypothetical protein CRN43_09135 [Candidatus Nephrothrix sp. EaCA]
MLNSLVIKNFRNLKDLKIDSLGRVNLIVGDNNAGKTSLLEAVGIYATRGDLRFIYDLLEARGEVDETVKGKVDEYEANKRMLSSLFTNRTLGLEGNEEAISIGQIFEEEGSSHATVLLQSFKFAEEWGKEVFMRKSRVLASFQMNENHAVVVRIGFEIKVGEQSIMAVPIDEARLFRTRLNFREDLRGIAQLIRSKDINREINGRLWDKIALTEEEIHVIEAMKIVEPSIERIAFIKGGAGGRKAVVKLSGMPHVLPLQSMGDGMNRILTVVLALVNCGNGCLLIDEFENGLYHTVQKKLWEIVFRLSKKLNVQVFATTHSEDCIAGFGEALNSPNIALDGKLIRIENKKGMIRAVEYTPKEIRMATEHHIETR